MRSFWEKTKSLLNFDDSMSILLVGKEYNLNINFSNGQTKIVDLKKLIKFWFIFI